jgi:branched-chain amino acid transport system ATP-binding protein
MTVLENLEVGASVKAARKARQQTIEWVYEIFPILKMRSKQKAGALSGGEQQMLAIGRALMSKPKLLLIDEMSLGLSPLAAQTISQVIKRLNESARVAILLVEQDVQLALTMADWGYVMENGRIIGQGEAKKLLCSREITEAYLGMAE